MKRFTKQIVNPHQMTTVIKIRKNSKVKAAFGPSLKSTLHALLPCRGKGAWVIQRTYGLYGAGTPKMDRTWWRVQTKCNPPGAGTGKPLQYLCQENSIDRNKKLKDMALEDEPLRLEGVEHANERRTSTSSSRVMKWLGQSGSAWKWKTPWTLQMMTAAMKLKDACFFGGKQRQT